MSLKKTKSSGSILDFMAFRSSGSKRSTEEEIFQQEEEEIHNCFPHAAKCQTSECASHSCSKLKKLIMHNPECALKAEGGCDKCEEFWRLLDLHIEKCRTPDCDVPHCEDARLRKKTRFSWQLLKKVF